MNKKVFILILSFSIFSLTANPFTNSPGISNQKKLYSENKTLKGPNIKILKTFHNCREFSKTMIDPNRYILSKTKTYPSSPVIVDIKTFQSISFPIHSIPGLENPPRVKGEEYKKLKLSGKYWKWHKKDLVYYNPEKNEAGLLLVKNETKKIIHGSPSCPKCRGASTYVEKYYRYYCYKCRKYIEVDQYMKDMDTTWYAKLDLKSNRIKWKVKLGENMKYAKKFFSIDPTGKYLYFCNNVYFYKKTKTSGSITLSRLNIPDKRLDWNYTFKVPVRYKKSSATTYSIRSFVSPDYTKFVFWEYDEDSGKGYKKGFLQNPPAQGFVVDVSSKTSFSIPVPSTPYGNLIDYENKYLILGSNQHGTLHRIDLKKKKQDLEIKSTKNIFHLILSNNSKYLYVMNKYNVEARSWPDLKLVKKIPLSTIFPGVRTILSSEPVYSTLDGRYAAIGVLKGKQWSSSDSNDGFHLLLIGE